MTITITGHDVWTVTKLAGVFLAGLLAGAGLICGIFASAFRMWR